MQRIFSFFYFLFLISFLFAKENLSELKLEKGIESFSRCWSNSNKQNEHWLNEGEIVERGKYIYFK